MRVAITRPMERSEETVRLVRERGWEAMIVPTVEIVPRDAEEIKAAVGGLRSYDWLVVTSSSGAEILYHCFGAKLKGIKVAAIGPKTREALEARGLRVEVLPDEYKAENLAGRLREEGIKGKRILVARAAIGREVLVDELRKEAEVVEVSLYDTGMPRDKGPMEAVAAALRKGEIDAFIFTSSQSARNLFTALGMDIAKDLKKAKVCAIGPVTAATLREFGVKVEVMPREYTVTACLDALEAC